MINKENNVNKKQLMAEYRQLQMAIAECELNSELMAAVMWREGSDQVLQDKVLMKDKAFDFEGDAESMYQGWAQLIKAYRVMNKPKLNGYQVKTLENTERMLVSLGKQFTEGLNKGPGAVAQATKDVIAGLRLFNEMYINTGHKRHHVVVRYSLEDGVYYRTEYNSGDGAQPTNDEIVYYDAIVDGNRGTRATRNVWVINKQPIKDGKLQEMVALDLQNNFASAPIVQAKRAEYLDPTVTDKSLKGLPQILGTCSSRSTSLLLRDRLQATGIFGDLYGMVSKSSLDNIKNDLNQRKLKVIQDLAAAGVQADPEVLQINIEPLLRKYKKVSQHKKMVHMDNWLDVFSEAIVRHIEAISGKELTLHNARQLKEEIIRASSVLSIGDFALPYTSLKCISYVAFYFANSLVKQNSYKSNDFVVQHDSMRKVFEETKAFLLLRVGNFGDELGGELVLSVGATRIAETLIANGLVSDLGYGGYAKARIVDEIKPILARVALVYHYDLKTMPIVLQHLQISLQDAMNASGGKIPSMGSEEFITVVVNTCKRLATDNNMFAKKSRHSAVLEKIKPVDLFVDHHEYLLANKHTILKNMSGSQEDNLKTIIREALKTPEYKAFLNLGSDVVGNSSGSIALEAFKRALKNHRNKPVDKVVPEVLKEVYKQVKVMTINIPVKKVGSKSHDEEKKPVKEADEINKKYGPNPIRSLLSKKVSNNVIGYMVAYGDIHPKHLVNVICQVFDKHLDRINLAETIIKASADKSYLTDPDIADAMKKIPAESLNKLSDANKNSLKFVKNEVLMACKAKPLCSRSTKIALGLALLPVVPSCCVYYGLCTTYTAASIIAGTVAMKGVQVAIGKAISCCSRNHGKQGVALSH